MTNNLILCGGKVFEQVDVPFAQTMKLHNLPEAPAPITQLTIPRIPYELFKQITAYQRSIAAKHRCETSTSLFLIEGEWIAETFYQSNTAGSMTADVDFTEERNAALLEKLSDASDVHATLHNHVFGGAGQSGRDKDDEAQLPGPHITIGHLDKEKLSFDARLSTIIDGKQTFLPLSFFDIIDTGLPNFPLSDSARKELENNYLTFESTPDEIPKAWEDRFELKKHAYQGTNHNYYAGRQSQHYGQTASKLSNVERELLSNADQIALWPYDLLSHLRLNSVKNLKADLRKLTPLGKAAALTVAKIHAKDPANPELKELLQHLKARKKELASK